ncbi:MAG: ferritin [Bacteroidales bacterium]|nr:ferritin [Bacteroidales bacterium]MDD4217749.1 ferritin [Bacteroidales bacterium]MDY0142174.1 ferritin [Bacteroidales bacterium]
MLKPKVEKILNEQIQKEGYSSFLYLSMASWSESKGMAGVAQWLYAQAEEEKMHMLKIIDFINERGGKAIIPAIDKTPEDWKDIFVLFDEVLAHEKYISESINDVVALTVKENDFATQNWVQWFVTEQIEEESSVQAIIDKLNLVGKNNLYVFDRDIMNLRTDV